MSQPSSSTFTKSSKVVVKPSKPAPATTPAPPPPPCLELQEFKAACKGKITTLEPSVDKATGQWSWRGKECERVWDTLFAGGAEIEKYKPDGQEVGAFTEKYEVTSGEMRVYGGLVVLAAGKEAYHSGFAVVFEKGNMGSIAAVQKVFELPPPLAFVCVHLLKTMHKVRFTEEKVLALLTSKATSARSDVSECISWMRDRLAAVERSPQAILTRCIELNQTAQEMHAHYLRQVVSRTAKQDPTRQKELEAELEVLCAETAADAEVLKAQVKAAAGAGAMVHEVSKAPPEVLLTESGSSDASTDPSPQDSPTAPPKTEEAAEEAAEEEAEEEAASATTLAVAAAGVEEDEDEEEEEEEEHPTPAERELSMAQRDLQAASEAHRQAKVAFERTTANLKLMQNKVHEKRELVDQEEEAREARRSARTTKAAAKAAAVAKAAAPPSPLKGKWDSSAVDRLNAADAARVLESGARAPAPAKALSPKSKETREIAELEAYDANAPEPLSAALNVLRSLSSVGGKGVSTEVLPFDPMRFVVHCDVVLRVDAPPEGSDAKGRWYVAMGSSHCVPGTADSSGEDEDEDEDEEDEEDDDEEEEEEEEEADDDLDTLDDEEAAKAKANKAAAKAAVRDEAKAERAASKAKAMAEAKEAANAKAAKVAAAREEAGLAAVTSDDAELAVLMCIAQTDKGELFGAVGWYELGSLPTSLDGALLTAERLPPPRRALALFDADWEPCTLMHLDCGGYGKGGKPVTPMGYNMNGPALFHLATGLYHYHVATAQATARLAQNHAGQEEKAHTEQLLDAARVRFDSVACEGLANKWLPPMDYNKCESAVQGLRKTLLRRPWNPRCPHCGVRHEDIEFSTCRFWQAWIV